jgi:hypothetical protein
MLFVLEDISLLQFAPNLLIASRKSQGPSGDADDNLWSITSRHFVLVHFQPTQGRN